MTTPDNARIDGQERLRKYLARLATARGFDKDHIHGFDAGEPTEAFLLASDVQAALDRIAALEAENHHLLERRRVHRVARGMKHLELAKAKVELIAQTNRAAAAEQQVTALTQRLDTANALNKEARNQLAQLSQAQAVPTEGLCAAVFQVLEGWTIPHPVRKILETAYYAASPTPPARKECWCETCRPVTLSDMRFVVCPDCGNKRCPKANNHDNACTNSNAPGQPGSSWEHVKLPARKGLSDERIKSIYFSCPDSAGTVEGFIKHARAIEAAHGIQGEGNE